MAMPLAALMFAPVAAIALALAWRRTVGSGRLGRPRPRDGNLALWAHLGGLDGKDTATMPKKATDKVKRAYYEQNERHYHEAEHERLRDPMAAARAVEKVLYPDDGEDPEVHKTIIARTLTLVAAAHGVLLERRRPPQA